MKKQIYLLIILCSFLLFGFTGENEIIEKQLDAVKADEISENLSDETLLLLDSLGIDINQITLDNIKNLSFADFIKMLYESAVMQIKETFKAIFYIIAAAIVCSVTNTFCDGFLKSGKVIDIVATLSSFGVILFPMKEIMEDSARVIEESSNFMLGFIPVYSSLITASGYISSAAGYRTLMLGAVTIISRISSEIILPVIGIYFAMCIAGSVSDLKIGEISKQFKNFAVWVLGISMTVFSGILGLGSLISSSTDSAFNKTAKFLIGSAVPVVGSTVSDAMTTLKGCISITKNVFGIYGIIVIAAVFVPPIITVILWKICLSVSATVCGIIENRNLSNLLTAASSAISITLALLVTTSIMFIFSVSILLMTGGAY